MSNQIQHTILQMQSNQSWTLLRITKIFGVRLRITRRSGFNIAGAVYFGLKNSKFGIQNGKRFRLNQFDGNLQRKWVTLIEKNADSNS